MKAIIIAIIACFGIAVTLAAVLLLYLLVSAIVEYFQEKNK